MNKYVSEDEEVITDSEQGVRKEKKKKTREERSKDRRAVFWFLLLVLFVTFIFWLKSSLIENREILDKTEDYMVEDGNETERNDGDGFYVKYKI